MDNSRLKFIAAPMVGQSDLPFRVLVRKHGATLAYTQMLFSGKLLNDSEYLEFHLKDLSSEFSGYEKPVVAQLCGNDPDTIVQAGRKVQNYCQAIDLNLGCPQEHARDGHYGAYLLGQKDWPLLENIGVSICSGPDDGASAELLTRAVTAMVKSFTVPVSVKIRLCQPSPKTLEISRRLAACGASWITLHARTVSARRRRQGAADLSEVRRLKEGLTIPVISNGNVRIHSDLWENLSLTGADGLMVGETLLGNPCIFTETVPDPVDISLEYLSLCHQYPGIASLRAIQTHVRHFIEFQWYCTHVIVPLLHLTGNVLYGYISNRRPWYPKFRAALSTTESVDEIQYLVSHKVERWRGRTPRLLFDAITMEGSSDDEMKDRKEFGSMAGDIWNSHLFNCVF